MSYLNTPNNLNEYDDPQSGNARVDDGVPDDFADVAATPVADGVNMMHDIKGRPIECRLADWLLQHAPPGISPQDAFDLPISKKVLAGQLGVTSETLSRTFARFRKAGLIRVSGPKFQLLNLDGLRAYSDF